MDRKVGIIVCYGGSFYKNAQDKWQYQNGMNKVKLVKTTITFRELEDVVYTITGIERTHQIVMKFIYHSIYDLDPVKIENDDDVGVFLDELQRTERSPIFVEVENRLPIITPDGNRTNAFTSGRGSNHLSSTMPALNVNNISQQVSGQVSAALRGEQEVNVENEERVNFDVEENPNVVVQQSIGIHTEYANEPMHNFFDQGAHVGEQYNHQVHNDPCVENDATIWEGANNVDNAETVDNPLQEDGGVAVDDILRVDVNIPVMQPIQHRSRPNGINQLASSSTSHLHSINQSETSSDQMDIGMTFTSKQDLQHKMGLYAIKRNFEFTVKRSTSMRWEIACVKDTCNWRMRATRVEGLDYFAIRTFNNHHECSSLNDAHSNHRQASSKLIGNHIKSKYIGIARQYKPKEIQFDLQRQYGISISYDKAWRAREIALNMVRGSPEESFRMLPLWCSMLESSNQGTITCIKTDSENRFLYSFMALGQSIAGFRHIRSVVAVDGTHLKGKYRGTMFIAACLDGNEQIFPLAFGIGDTENESSYTWFFERFKEAFGEVEGLVFITDRHRGLERAIAKVFPNAYHGHCMYHLSCNVKQHFGKNKNIFMSFYQAAKAYLVVDFEKHMSSLETIDIRAHRYVMEAAPEKWARSQFPGNRYNIMTTNIAECMNAILRDARSLPICALLETIRFIIQDWFYSRRTTAEETLSPVTPWLEHKLNKRLEKCRTLNVIPLNSCEFEVRSIDFTAIVNLSTRT